VSIVLFRVDERLIHGQVVIGWGNELRPERYIVVDDELADSDWEQELYRLAVADSEVVFASVDEARRLIPTWMADTKRSVVLTRGIRSMCRLAEEGGLAGQHVNLGGLHHAAGKSELLPYLYVTESDRTDLLALESAGVDVVARDLPDAQRVSLAALLGR
jgi:PTS system mannose-specific IIB component/fructoselysine and glucoselysine-specific PTS system IIB component